MIRKDSRRSPPCLGPPSLAVCLLLALLLPGCSSVAKGVTQAYLESRAQQEDTRGCWVRGPSFLGLERFLDRQEELAKAGVSPVPTLKVLMVHGIGDHVPGHATQLSEKLARALSLTRTERRFKQFDLRDRDFPGEDLGTLRVTRFVDATGARDMLFYELTWDPIVEEEKRTIAFDSSAEYSFRRAQINDGLKAFVNDTVPDVMMYQGGSRERIQESVSQAICVMFSNSWNGLPRDGQLECGPGDASYLAYLSDSYAFITHSLGSRIMADALERVANFRSSQFGSADPAVADRIAELRQRDIQVFMLSNQLPLLQLGQAPPTVSGQIEAICGAGSPRESERLFSQTSIVAFSDPNDILSYAIPPGYLDENIDSRLCPELVNVILNVAEVHSILGLGEVANPMTAHLAYEVDDRVIGLITRGIGNDEVLPVVRDRCEWTETF